MNLIFKLLKLILVLVLLITFGFHRLNILNTKTIELSNFSWINKVEIYGLGTIMAVTGAPLYPEIARMHFMLYTPFKDGVKSVENDFFMRSAVVKSAIQNAVKSGKSHRLAWPASVYKFSMDNEKYHEARIALALNGGYLRIEDNMVIVNIAVAYPRNSFAPLFTVPGYGVVGVQEGLYWILQQEGWYHTGSVEWIAPLLREAS
jgi:hypothetical protein